MSSFLYKCQQCHNSFNENEIIFITNKNDFVICNTCITKSLISQKNTEDKAIILTKKTGERK